MSIFNISMSYIKHQRGKTLALLSAVSLAVMLIFSMNVIRDSGYDSQIQEAKDLYGDYSVYIDKVDINKINKIKKQQEVTKVNTIRYFCEITNKNNGVTMDLNTFDKGYIESIGYKFVGRDPKNDGEIVIEKEALSQMGISDSLNKNIDLMMLNKYLDKDKINQIESVNKTYKIVGIVEKPEKYYKAINGFKTQAFVYKDSVIPIKNISEEYKGTVYLKDYKQKKEFSQRMQKLLKLDNYHLYISIEVEQAEQLKFMLKFMPSTIRNIILLIVVASIVTYNIFNIILQDMIKQIGMMRAIGMSNKQIKKMFRISSFIYVILGTAIGLLAGSIFSYFGVRVVFGYSSILSIEWLSIVYSFLASIISVSFASSIIVKKALKMSIVDSIRNIDNGKSKKRKYTNKNLTSGNMLIKLANKNIFRSKSRTIITIVAISLVSIMFIEKYSYTDLIKNNTDVMGGIGPRSYGNIDLTLSGEYQNSEDIFYKVDKDLISKVKKLDNVTKTEANYCNKDSYLIIDKNKIDKTYKDELGRKNINYKSEYPLIVRGYNDNLLKNIDSFIEQGENLTKQNETLQKQSDYKKVILVNNIYSRVTNSFDTSVIKGAKVGDTIDIKLPVHKDNVEKYENFKVQVAGITNKTYIATQDGEPQFKGGQVIFREDDYRELTGQKDCNKLYIMSNENTIDEVEKNLMSLVKDSSFTSIGGKNEDNKYLAGLRSSEDRLDFIYQILIIFILVVNIAFIIRSNIITRTKELSILRAVGMKKEKLRKMIILESELYGVISVIVSSVIATILYNKRIMNMNNINLSAGYVRTVGFNIPFKAILIVAVISIAMCYMSVYFSKGKIEGISIIEGISEE